MRQLREDMFDPLDCVNELKRVGFTPEQAEVQTKTFMRIVNDHTATKRDLKELEVALKNDSADLRRDLKELDVKLEQKIKELDVKSDQRTKELDVKSDQKFKEFDVKLNSLSRDIKELEVTSKKDAELMRRDIKIWFGSLMCSSSDPI